MPEDHQLAADVAQIRKDVDSILHGNGRKGLWAISDAVFGGKDREREPGLLSRMQVIEDRHKETKWLIRGIALGVSLVAADTVLGLDLATVVASFLSR